MTAKPVSTSAQALDVLEILERWVHHGYEYRAGGYAKGPELRPRVLFTDPENPFEWTEVSGENHFDALCQATTTMHLLLSLLHPETTPGELNSPG